MHHKEHTNQTCYKGYTWSMLNCNGEFLENDCSSAEIATCLGVLSYCRLKKAPLSTSLYILSYSWRTSLVKIGLRLRVGVDLINYSQNSVGVARVIYSAEKQKRVSYESTGTGLFHQQL